MNEIYLSFIQSTVIIIIYYIFLIQIIKNSKIEKNFINILFLYHLLFCLFYFLYSHFEISDSKTVYYLSFVSDFNNFIEQEKATFELELGQPFMVLILRSIVYPLQMTYFSSTILFGIISFSGMVVIYGLLRSAIDSNSKFEIILMRIFFFFPSLHFWQMSMSKDALVFFCIALFILFQKNLIKFFYLGIISLTIIFLLRPYLLPFLLTFTYMNFIFNNSISRNLKILTVLFSSLPFFIILQRSLAYAGIDLYQFDLNNPFLLIEQIKVILMDVQYVALTQNAGIDKTNLNIIYQIFIYLFGPINIFIDSFLYKIASVENLLLLTYIIILILNKNIKNIDLFRFSLFLIFLSLLIAFSVRTSNYGISMRQKWMILPFLLVFLSNFDKINSQNKIN